MAYFLPNSPSEVKLFDDLKGTWFPTPTMCFACTEYIKNRLTSQELKKALKEVGIDNPSHQKQVEDLIQKYDDPEDLKQALKPITETKDY